MTDLLCHCDCRVASAPFHEPDFFDDGSPRFAFHEPSVIANVVRQSTPLPVPRWIAAAFGLAMTRVCGGFATTAVPLQIVKS